MVKVHSPAFEEAFDRMEKYTNVRNCRSLDELRLVAERFFGDKWYPTDKQKEALIDEAERRGYFERWKELQKEKEKKLPWYARTQPEVSTQTYRHETVTVRGKSQVRYRYLKTGRFIKKPK
jgi:hypothetical protein